MKPKRIILKITINVLILLPIYFIFACSDLELLGIIEDKALEYEWVLQATLTAPDGAGGDLFGQSVAIDGNYAFVSASGDNSLAGSVYMYKRNDTVWSNIAPKIVPTPALEANDSFGNSISLSGDLLSIGAHGDDDTDSFAGAVYLFKRTNDSVSQIDKLLAQGGALGDLFGKYLDLSGNFLIASSPNYNSSEGKVQIYEWDGSDLLFRKTLTRNSSNIQDHFGDAVAISNGIAVVGVPAEDGASNTDIGHTDIYYQSGIQWGVDAGSLENVVLSADTLIDNEQFGYAVSYADNWLAVGSFNYSKVALYQYLIDSWSSAEILTDSKFIDADRFGTALSLSGSKLIIGASGYQNAGSAYIYEYRNDTWQFSEELISPVPVSGDEFGFSVEISGDYAIVGARNRNLNGAAFIYHRQRKISN